MNKEFKRIRNHSIEYFCIFLFFLLMSIIGVLGVLSESFKGNSKITALVLSIVFLLLLIYLLFLWIPLLDVYRRIKKVKTEEYTNRKIKIIKVSFIFYRAKHYCGASAMKIYCMVEDREEIFFYIFKEDNIFYKDVQQMISGYLDVTLYNNSKIIKSFGSKLDKKINFYK